MDEFQHAYDLGVFGYDARLELIEGEIIRKMPQTGPHAWAIQAVTEIMRPIFGEGHAIRVQLPIGASSISGPEPDVAVVAGSFHDCKRARPTTTIFVVEVSDTTLAYDRSTKAALCARAGIEDYWIVNLPDGVLEVHRQLAQLGRPNAAIAVSALLP